MYIIDAVFLCCHNVIQNKEIASNGGNPGVASNLLESLGADTSIYFMQINEVLKGFKMDYANYWLAKHKQIGNYSTNNNKAIEKVYLTFL